MHLQHDRPIWDLFYNGVMHSLANGASIDDLAQEVLEIPRSAKEAKLIAWRDHKPLPNWPADLDIPDRDKYEVDDDFVIRHIEQDSEHDT